MFKILGVIQLILVGLVVYKGYKKQGISIVVDSFKIMGLIWLLALSLYNIALSGWYKPNIQINIIVGIIVAIFLAISKKVYIEDSDIKEFWKDNDNKTSTELYSIAVNFIFVIASIIFIDNILRHGLVILSKGNKIGKQPIDHYAGYIIYMLTIVAQIKYILFRQRKKFLDLFVFVGSIVILIATMNRGPIAFIVAAIYVYEIFSLVKNIESMTKKQVYIIVGILVAMGLVFAQFFAIIGNMRVEHVLNDIYKTTLNEHYKMSGLFPSAFVWIYIYMTSPLENAAFSIVNQVADSTFFNNLFYPFIKFFANIMGKGDIYKEWLMQQNGYTPYLDGNPGLNVSSFIPQAMQDMSYLGVVVYVAIYAAFAYLVIRIIKNKKFSLIGSFIIYANVLNLLLWSIFENSLRVPIILMNIIFVVFIELFMKMRFFRVIEDVYWNKIRKKNKIN